MDPTQPTVGEASQGRSQRRRIGVVIAIVVAFAAIMLGRNVWLDRQHDDDVNRFHDRQVCVMSGRSDC